MRSISIPSSRYKKILLGIASLFAWNDLTDAATTYSFNNGASSNAWNVANNWFPISIPAAVDTAFVDASLGDTLYLTDGGSSAPAEIATLNFTGTPSNQYQFLAGFGSTAKDITFGGGGATPTFANINSFNDANVIFGGGVTTINVPSKLTIRSNEGTTQSATFKINGNVQGSGSIVLAKLSGASTAKFYVGEGISTTSQYTGGTTIDPDTTVWVQASSQPDSGSLTMTSGPFGLGTCNLNAGTLYFTFGAYRLGNDINTIATDSTIFSKQAALLFGAVRTNGHRLRLDTHGAPDSIVFEDAGWSSSDSGTIALVSGGSAAVKVNSGTSTYGGFVGNAGTLGGTFSKTGGGVFEARHFRVETLDVQEGTLRVLQEGSGPVGGTINTSRVDTLNIAGGSIATARLDLMNNDLIIDWSGSDPLGAGTASVLIKQLQTGRNGGAWNGNGIITSLGAGSAALGIGYLTQADLGTTTFSGQTIDNSTVVVKMTYAADHELDGDIDIDDFKVIGPNFGTAQTWFGGDFTHDGICNISDYQILNPYFNYGTAGSGTPQLRGGLPVRTEMYLEMLNWPEFYWAVRDWTEHWNEYYAEIEAMNLAPIPARPESRSVPEPTAALLLSATASLLRRRA